MTDLLSGQSHERRLNTGGFPQLPKFPVDPRPIRRILDLDPEAPAVIVDFLASAN